MGYPFMDAEDLEYYRVTTNPSYIMKIKNPSDELIEAALEKNPHSYRFKLRPRNPLMLIEFMLDGNRMSLYQEEDITRFLYFAFKNPLILNQVNDVYLREELQQYITEESNKPKSKLYTLYQSLETFIRSMYGY